MAIDQERGSRNGRAGGGTSNSPKPHGDKLGAAVGDTTADEARRDEAAGDPAHDSPKPHGDKLENARDEAAGHGKR